MSSTSDANFQALNGAETGKPATAPAPAATNSNSTSNCCSATCSMFCATFGFLFVMGLFFALPIAEIIMAEKYRDDMSCPNDIISPYTWMLTEGIVGIFIYGFCGIVSALLLIDNDSSKTVGVILYIPLVILSMFHFAWIIVGAIMFWRDCIDLETKSMNDFYWAVLIINLVSIYMSGKSGNDEKK